MVLVALERPPGPAQLVARPARAGGRCGALARSNRREPAVKWIHERFLSKKQFVGFLVRIQKAKRKLLRLGWWVGGIGLELEYRFRLRLDALLGFISVIEIHFYFGI